ncbi:long-chain-fatty-acid-CoA ligase 1 [Microthyrium microscopicum]|uniref:Long-chain-fatty-acid-CoA ligase 1 n=1 Tax=Microthyrium microscopicum TaxID=703497 RepID=A0A6A6TWY9_9PEZI|nr:long-chain-fatty-acid-CoA ligase 1 [Microthyrium microscopicum]
MPIPNTDLKKLYPLPKLYNSDIATTEVTDQKAVAGETVPRRNHKTPKELKWQPAPEISTVHDIMRYASKKFGNAKALGSRKLIKMHNDSKMVKKVIDGKETEVEKKWQYFELGPYTHISFVEFEKLALQVGAGLRKLGLEPGDKLHLFAATHPHWLASAHAAMSQSIPIVTAYDTLGEEAVTHSMLQTNAKAIYLDPHLLKTLINPLKKAKDITKVIYNTSDPVKEEDIAALKEAHPHLEILSFEDVRKLGEENPIDTVPPKADDLACIMYTSGSTGTPKGVKITHKNIVASVCGICVIVGVYLGPGDGLLAYLPLAHILEFVFENTVMFVGGTLGYGNFRTLSDTNCRNCVGDIKEFKPTILVGVPAVWEQVKKGIITKVQGGSAITKSMFWGAMSTKEFLLGRGLPGVGIIDSIVFSKVREATGGKLRIAFNGGGPISKETLKFISMAICPLISGYGLTETVAAGAIQDPLKWYPDALGEVPGSVEMKLVDYEDAGYKSTNNPPQGEIWIRGHSITQGYLDNEEETKAAYTDDGWFKTGDIGEWDKNGQIKIIDRKKNLVKTVNGEYIALEKLESVYRSDSVVANICVYADQSKSKPIAIIFPAEPALKKMAQENGISGDHLEELIHDAKLQNLVHNALLATGRKGGLKGIELIDGVVLADEEWTPQNGFTTSAQKLNRKKILEHYKKEVDAAYKKAGQ